MLPRFRAGCRLVIVPSEFPRTGTMVLARLKDASEALFREYHRTGVAGSIVRLVSSNPAYPPIEQPLALFSWIYTVLEVHERLRY